MINKNKIYTGYMYITYTHTLAIIKKRHPDTL